MKALNQKCKSPVVINMVQDDWNEALTKPSSMISTAALMLGSWIVLLSIVNMFGGGRSSRDKVAWIGFFGFGGDAFVPGVMVFSDDAIFVILGIALVGMGLRNSM